MKRIFKRTLSIFLAVVILLGSVPISRFVGVDLPNFNEIFATKAKAIEASDLPEDFDLVTYNIYANFDEAEGHYGGLFYMLFRDMVKFGSLSQIVYNSFDNSSEFLLTVEAWESIRMISDPSSVAEALEFQRQYEEVIFAALFSALSDEKYTEFSYSNALSKATGLSSSKTAELLDKTSLDGTEKQELIDTAFAFLTNGKDVESKWSALGEYTDIVNKYISIADDIAEGVVSAINIIDSVSMYVSMLDSGAEVIEYLYDLKGKSPNSVFSAAVQTVINTISNDWVGVVGKTIIDVGFVLGMEATDKLIDYAWTGCCAVFPFLTGLYIGGEIGALACNILFGTEDLIEQYEYLKIMTQIEAVSCALYEDYGESCSVYVNSDNAALFTFATRFSYMLYLLGGEAGIEMFNIACNKGIVTKLITGESFDNFEETAIEILDGSKDSYNNVVSCWKKCIEEDYPDFFKTLTEEEIEPKYIESITMDKDEVTFRVGEIMSYSWTIAPLDYEGSLGIRSDNEAVVKSREPMGIQTYALEENIGTANVTIYSIDNPEICDTIKITVIGEDYDGVTEEDSKYITGDYGDNLTWCLNINTGRLFINGVGKMDCDFSESAPWSTYCSYIKKATIGNGITCIDDNAFKNCDELISIVVPDSVICIGSYAFYRCEKLLGIIIPDGVTMIKEHAFQFCESLAEIVVPNRVTAISDYVFDWCSNLKSVIIGNAVTTIGNSAFRKCFSLTSITIPDSVTIIDEYAFSYCDMLKNVYYTGDIAGWCSIIFNDLTSNPLLSAGKLYINNQLVSELMIPNSITSINKYAFYGCSSITNVKMADSVTSIGRWSFYNCCSLKSLSIGNNVKSIDDYSFKDCTSLTYITIPDSVTDIDYDSFENTAYYNNEANWEFGVLYIDKHLIEAKDDIYGTYKIKEGTLTIAASAFSYCYELTNVTIPDSVTNICGGAFKSCTSLESVSIGNGVTNIGEAAFNECTKLTRVAIPDRVTKIGEGAFQFCESLINVTLGNSVTSIEKDAFESCIGLTSIIIPDSVTTIGESAFENFDNLSNVTIGKGITNIGSWAFRYCSPDKNVFFTGTMSEWCKKSDILLHLYVDGDLYISGKVVDGDLVIPDGVTSIGSYAFYNCDSITSVTIPDGVTSIGSNAFYNCDNITSITIPNTITTIGSSVIEYCDNLIDIYFNGTEKEWETISIDDDNWDLRFGNIHFLSSDTDIHIHSHVSSVSKQATCSSTGVMVYTCECGNSFTETIPMISHLSSEWQIILEPTTETEGKKIKKCTVCGVTIAEELIAKLPKEPVKDNSVVKNPSTSSISYGDSIILHVDASKIPEGGYVEWTASNGNFDMDVSSDGTTCKISPSSKGDTTFTATVYDANGNAVSADEQVMTSKAGFFDKIIAFFKKLFGLTKTIPQIYKGIF